MRRWILGWLAMSVVMATMAVSTFPDLRRFVTKPRWVLSEQDEAKRLKKFELLNQPAPYVSSATTLTKLVEELKQFGNFAIDDSRMRNALVPEIEIDFRPLSEDETLGELLLRVLERQDLTISVDNTGVKFVNCESQLARMSRMYPCPVVDSVELTEILRAGIHADWECEGGEDVFRFVDTDNQTLIFVECNYQAHLEIERLLYRLSQAAGIGFRKDATKWNRLGERVCSSLTKWISHSSTPPAGANGSAWGIAPTAGMGCGGF